MSLKTKEVSSKIKFDLPPEKIEDLYGRIERSSGEYLLGKVPLESPLADLEVKLETQKRQFSLTAQIGVEMTAEDLVGQKKGQKNQKKKTQKKEIKMHIPLGFLKKRFKVRKIKDLVVVLNSDEHYEYALHDGAESSRTSRSHPHPLYGMFDIHSGFLPPSFQASGITVNAGEDEDITLVEKPLRSLEEFSKELQKFFELLKATLEGVYTEQETQIPDILFLLRPKDLETEKEDSESRGPFRGRGALERVIEAENPQVSFKEIGGLEKAKEETRGLCFALTNPSLYEKWGTKPPKGILFFGPPGTGKTLLVKALATAVKARFYHVRVTDVNSVWHSFSEKNMQQVFDIAKKNQPSIIFIDEIDALASDRDFLDGINRKVVSVLLENLSGMGSSDNVIVVASTNRPDAVDPAIKRAGRFDRLIKVDNPDEKGRREIFDIHILAPENIAKRKLFAKLDYTALAQKTDGMNGADIREIIRRTLEKRVREEGNGNGKEVGLVDTARILKEIESYERVKKTEKEAGFK